MKMVEDNIFFAKDDTEGIKLTSTSANHVANLAKEYIQTLESQLNGVSFLDVNVGLVSSEANKPIQLGWPKEKLNGVQQMLEQVAQSKSLIAWLREGIKAKENLINGLNDLSIEDWCALNGKEMPVMAPVPKALTKEEYYASLSVKERNRYYYLETVAAVYGKYVHTDGEFSKSRKELANKVEHPYSVSGTGRDALIYHYTGSVSVEDVDNTFFELQKRHREVQSQLNSMKHDCEVAINKSICERNTKAINAQVEHREKWESLRLEYTDWKDKKAIEYGALKIIIPNSLLDIYKVVNSLGK